MERMYFLQYIDDVYRCYLYIMCILYDFWMLLPFGRDHCSNVISTSAETHNVTDTHMYVAFVCVCVLSVLTCRPSMRVSRINARHSISKFKPKWLVTYAEIKMFKNIINFILSTLSLSFYWIEIINIFSFSLQIHYSLS